MRGRERSRHNHDCQRDKEDRGDQCHRVLAETCPDKPPELTIGCWAPGGRDDQNGLGAQEYRTRGSSTA